MNSFEEKLIEWSERQFNVKLHSKDAFHLFRTKNGSNFKKLLDFMSDRFKSKKDGESIKRFCRSIDCQNQMKSIGNEIKEIECKITPIRNQLIAEELNRKRLEIKDNYNENKAFVSTLILNSIESISTNNKLCTQLVPNLKAINGTTGAFETLFDDFQLQNINTSDETLTLNNNRDCNQILDEMNELIESISSIVYDLNQLETMKPIDINIDLESLSKVLANSEPIIEVNEQNKKAKDRKTNEIALKLSSVKELMKKYETIRSEKLMRSRDKLQKVINSCDGSVQKNRLKCFE